MASKRKAAKVEQSQPHISLTECSFTSSAPNREVVDAAVALARAAEANAKAIERVAGMLKGPDGPMIAFTAGK